MRVMGRQSHHVSHEEAKSHHASHEEEKSSCESWRGKVIMRVMKSQSSSTIVTKGIDLGSTSVWF